MSENLDVDEDAPQDTSEITEATVADWFESEDELTEVTPGDIDVAQRYSEAQLRIVRSNMDLSLHNLRQSLKDASYINLSPTYQRRHRWDGKKRSQLIESLLLNIPIPPIFLFENDYNQYEIMDGRQRLEAIKDFLDNSYPLRGMEYWPELNRTRFGELPPTIQRGLLRRTISAIVLLAETSRPEDSEIDVRMALFKRLNTGGVNLNPHELRNALYPSPFNEMLQRLARWDTFRETWRIPLYTDEEAEEIPKKVQSNALYKTMADCELVLRFFAIKETIIDERSGSLRRLLDDCLMQHAKDKPSELESMENEFREVLTFLFKTFGGKPFVLPQTSRPSRPAYDAMMVATAITGLANLEGKDEAIRSSFLLAANDSNLYEILVGRGNTVEAIKARVILARDILTK